MKCDVCGEYMFSRSRFGYHVIECFNCNSREETASGLGIIFVVIRMLYFLAVGKFR